MKNISNIDSDNGFRLLKYGTKVCKVNGQLHREDGPAVEYTNGDKMWYFNDRLHREDGPAVEYANGKKSWWINGYCIDNIKVIFNALIYKI